MYSSLFFFRGPTNAGTLGFRERHQIHGSAYIFKCVNLSLLLFCDLLLMIIWLYLFFNYHKRKYKNLIIHKHLQKWFNCSFKLETYKLLKIFVQCVNVFYHFLVFPFENFNWKKNRHHKFKITMFWTHPLLKTICHLGKMVI